jgi:hypothetical protein
MTKIEAFKPTAGSICTLGYDEIEGVKGVSVEVREMRDAQGGSVCGLLVRVAPDQYYRDLSFVDMDEIPGLLKGFDVLLDVKANPTKFESFEVQYLTRGGFQLTAFNNWNTVCVRGTTGLTGAAAWTIAAPPPKPWV